MRKIIMCLFVVNTIVAQNQRVVKTIEKNDFIKSNNLNERLIKVDENFEVDFAKLTNGKINQSISFVSGKYNIQVNEEYPFGVVILKVKDNKQINPFESFFINCSFRDGKNCDRHGFRCLVLYPIDEMKMKIEQVRNGDKVEAIKFIALDESLFGVWEDPNNPNGGCTNPKNPFDNYGRLHNEKLDQLVNSKEYFELKKSYKINGKKAISDFLSRLSNNMTNSEIISALMKDKSIRIEELTKNLNMNPIVKEYLNTLRETISIVLKDGMVENSEYRFFTTIEDKILSSRINKKEKNGILTMYATARYSLQYWEMYRKGKKDIINLDGSIEAIKEIDWDEVGAVDTICGLAGPEAAAVGSLADYLIQLAKE